MAKAKRHTRGRGSSFGEFVKSEPELTALTDGALRREEISKVFEHDPFNFRYKLGPAYDILRYLSKMFQVEVELAPTEQQVRDFLDRQLNAIPYWTKRLSKEHRRLFSDIVLRLARQNPREVKRLLNSGLMAAAGAEMMRGPGRADRCASSRALQDFFIRRILQQRFPSIASMIDTDTGSAFLPDWSRLIIENKDAGVNDHRSQTPPGQQHLDSEDR